MKDREKTAWLLFGLSFCGLAFCVYILLNKKPEARITDKTVSTEDISDLVEKKPPVAPAKSTEEPPPAPPPGFVLDTPVAPAKTKNDTVEDYIKRLNTAPPKSDPFVDAPIPPPPQSHWIEHTTVIGLCVLNLLLLAGLAFWTHRRVGLTRLQQAIVIFSLFVLTWNICEPPIVERYWFVSNATKDWTEWKPKSRTISVIWLFESSREWITEFPAQMTEHSYYGGGKVYDYAIGSRTLLLFHFVIAGLACIAFVITGRRRQESTST